MAQENSDMLLFIRGEEVNKMTISYINQLVFILEVFSLVKKKKFENTSNSVNLTFATLLHQWVFFCPLGHLRAHNSVAHHEDRTLEMVI